jgi:hypothetical protein
VDMELPVVPPVHVFNTDLQGIAAISATGEDGEEYCVIDSTVIVDNPAAREYANQVYIKACCRARRRSSARVAT